MKIQIKHRYTNTILFEAEAISAKVAVVTAVQQKANLSRADLFGANLSGANLSGAKDDLWAVLLSAPREINALLTALREGKVDGSFYSGECACLVGTIANARHCAVEALPDGLKPDSNRPAERWFLAINRGKTPENDPTVKITVEWIEELQHLLLGAVAQLQDAAA